MKKRITEAELRAHIYEQIKKELSLREGLNMQSVHKIQLKNGEMIDSPDLFQRVPYLLNKGSVWIEVGCANGNATLMKTINDNFQDFMKKCEEKGIKPLGGSIQLADSGIIMQSFHIEDNEMNPDTDIEFMNGAQA